MSANSQDRRAILAAALALLPLLAGCGGLLPKPPERQLYRLTPTLDPIHRAPRFGAQLLIATPSAPAGIDSKRIALTRSAVSLDYFADAEWVERPPFLVKAAVIEGFEKSKAFAGVSSEGLGLRGDFVLNIEIRDFTAIYDSPNGPPRIRVQLDAELVRMQGRSILAETSLVREAQATANNVPAVVMAFNQAVGGIVGDLVTWTVGNPALSRKRN